MQIPVRSFTWSYDRIVNVLKSPVNISTAFDPRFTHKPPEFKEFIAVWDTGATNTFISQKVIDDCDLKPTSVIDVQTAGKGFRSPVYLANLMLPNQVGFANFRVARATIADGDVLIGMDVMAIGDFAVTNKDGKTAFSFRVPSLECIDFTGKMKQESSVTTPQTSKPLRKVGRNDPCPCGSGKKYKKCCGK